MAVELFPEMAQNVFQPLLRRLEKDRSEDFSTSEIRELLLACGICAAVLDRLIEIFRGILRRGVEKRKLTFFQEEFLDVVALAADEAYPRVQGITANDALSEEERISSLKTLEEYIKRAKSIGEELKALQPWLERPMPDVDISAFHGQSFPGDYEGYEDTKDIEARLRAGGDI